MISFWTIIKIISNRRYPRYEEAYLSAKKINQIDWEFIKKEINGEPVVFAVDVAKTTQFALLTWASDKNLAPQRN